MDGLRKEDVFFLLFVAAPGFAITIEENSLQLLHLCPTNT